MVILRIKRALDLICAGLLLVLWLLVWIPRLKGPIDLRWDASTYYVLGTALSEGRGYRLLNEPGNIEAAQYPPLLPLIVAAHQRLMGTTDYVRVGSALRITYFLTSGLFVLAAYALVRKLVSPLYALLIVASATLSFYSFIHPSDILYAEMPFALVSTLFLLCHKSSDGPFRSVALGCFGSAAYLLRFAGIALLLAWIIESLIRRRVGGFAIRTAVSAIPILIWQAHVGHVTKSDEYRHPFYAYQRASYYYSNVTYAENSKLIDPFRPEAGRTSLNHLIRRLVSNLRFVPLSLGESALIPSDFKLRGHSRTTFYLLCACLTAAGLVSVIGAALVAIGSEWFLSLDFALTIAIIIVTPWHNQFWRYFGPIAPLTLAFLVVSLVSMQHWVAERTGKLVQNVTSFVAACLAAVTLFVQISVANYFLGNLRPVSYYDSAGREKTFHLLTYDRPWHALDQAFEWIRRRAAPNTIVATTVPHLGYLRGGHKAVLPPFEFNPPVATRLLDEVPVRYLVLDEVIGPQISQRYAAPLVTQNPSDWTLVFTAYDNRTRIFERARSNTQHDL